MRILYLDIDTLRPDHLGCYGYHRATSPTLDRLAAEGVVFDNFCTPDAPCLPSRSSLMTGTFGIHHGCVNHGGHNAELRPQGASRSFRSRMSYDTLPAFLNKDLGLRTTYIGGFGERHSTFAYYAGFREILDTGKYGAESAEDVLPTTLKWLGEHAATDNWYLHVNLWDPHTPYRAPASFGNPFADSPLPAWPDEAEIERQWRECVGPHGIGDISMYDDRENPRFPRQPGAVRNLADLRRLFDGYDCGIAYADQACGQIIAALEKAGVYDDLFVIVSSDHGENMGELGLWAEHATADAVTPRIPMIVKGPGIPAGARDTGLHYNIDLLPSIAEFFGKEPRKSWEGESFAGDKKREFLVLSQCCHGCQRSVRWGDWIYIRTYHDFYHLFPREMLFNLRDDPHETNDLAPTRPEIVAQCAKIYLDWLDDMMATQPDGYVSDPLWETMLRGGPFHSQGCLDMYCNRLEADGRGRFVPALKDRHKPKNA